MVLGSTPKKEKRRPKKIPVRSLPAVQWIRAPSGESEVEVDGVGAAESLDKNVVVDAEVGVGGGRLAR
jgi:hypothetical protein